MSKGRATPSTWTRAGRDIHPLDIDLDQEWENSNDPRIEAWKRALDLLRQLSAAAFRLAVLVAAADWPSVAGRLGRFSRPHLDATDCSNR
jgi:hypothetical protein